MITYKQYKQWKAVNESFSGTFGSVLTQPVVVGGVVGSSGESSLENTKSRIRKYMLGEDADEESDDPKPKKKKSGLNLAPPKKGNPFGGGADAKSGAGFGGEDDDDDDDMGGDDQGDDDQDFGDDDDDLGDDDQDMGDDQDSGDDDDSDDDDMGDDDHANPFGDKSGKPSMDKFGGGMGDEGDDDDNGDLGGDDDMGDPMGGGGGLDSGMGGSGGGMGGDDMGMGGPGMGGDFGASAKGHVCHKCGHHEPDKNAKFCKMCGKGMSEFMKKYMSADDHPAEREVRRKEKKYGVSLKNGTNGGKGKGSPWLDKSTDNGEIKQGGRQTAKDMFKTVKGGKKESDRDPNKTGGRITPTRAKNESRRICATCGSLACEIHNGQTPSADRLSKSFFRSLTKQVGSRGGVFDDGIHADVVEDALYEPERTPFPGEAGYAPQGKIGGFLG